MKLKELLGAGADAANKKTDKSNKKKFKTCRPFIDYCNRNKQYIRR